jgi:phosphatidylglycerol:prolipoprotein diacylglycerol transferase
MVSSPPAKLAPTERMIKLPVDVVLGPLALHPHWIFESLAYTLGFYLYRRLRRRHGDVIESSDRRWVIAAAIVGGFAGSRVLSAFEDPVFFADHWSELQRLLAGKTVVGGLIGGLIAVESIKRLRGIRVATGDLLALPLALGISIGRIGCFLSGVEDESYGIATRLPWGVDFGDGIARHPTQLYEIIFLMALGAILSIRARLAATVGDRFKLFMVGYLGFRFLVEFIKPQVRVGGLSAIQWVCLATVAYYAPHVPRLVTRVGRG